MKKLNITLYIIGEKPEIFENLARKFNINYKTSHTLKQAVKEIDKVLNNNEVALLSPACASFDQFQGYKHRGEEFKKCINSLQQ